MDVTEAGYAINRARGKVWNVSEDLGEAAAEVASLQARMRDALRDLEATVRAHDRLSREQEGTG